MGWLGARLRKKSETNAEEAELGAPEATSSGPPLALLVPDVAGVTSFRLLRFPTADEAAEYIEVSLPASAISAVHAFWALQKEPRAAEGASGEAMVLIRTAAESEMVYVVSFVDIQSAQSFARFEARRGMNIGLLMIYWAELVTVERNGDGLYLTPQSPPVYAQNGAAAHEFDSRSQVQVAEALVTRRPVPHRPRTDDGETPESGGAEQAVTSAAEVETEESLVAEPEQGDSQSLTVEDIASNPEAEVSVIDPAVSEPGLEVEWPVPDEPLSPQDRQYQTSVAVKEAESQAAVAEAKAEYEEPAELPDDSRYEAPSAMENPAAPATVAEPDYETPTAAEEAEHQTPIASEELEHQGPVAIEEPEREGDTPKGEREILELEYKELSELRELEPQAGLEPDEKTGCLQAGAPAEPEARAAEPPAQAGGATAIEVTLVAPLSEERDLFAAEETDEATLDEAASADVAAEVEKILRVQRWEKRDKPFRGFDSPPGRF